MGRARWPRRRSTDLVAATGCQQGDVGVKLNKSHWKEPEFAYFGRHLFVVTSDAG